MEKYLAAADETSKALVLGPPPKRKQTFPESLLLVQARTEMELDC